MLSVNDFVRQSLETHLFFARIMKEHSFFLEVGFTPKDSYYMRQADAFRMEFDALLGDVISLSNGVVSNNVVNSGEIHTEYTMSAEMASSFYTGIGIPTNLTQAEANITGGDSTPVNPMLEQMVYMLNQKAMSLTRSLIQFKSTILNNVLSCNMFTVNYPLLIDHIMREAKLYYSTIDMLQNKNEITGENDIYDQEMFWNTIMAEHSKFIRGLLDPTEVELFNAANNFGAQFDKLTEEAKVASEKALPVEKVTEDSLKATEKIKEFKTAGTKGLLECKIKSIILPLLGDHVLREANHYLRLLKSFAK